MFDEQHPLRDDDIQGFHGPSVLRKSEVITERVSFLKKPLIIVAFSFSYGVLSICFGVVRVRNELVFSFITVNLFQKLTKNIVLNKKKNVT